MEPEKPQEPLSYEQISGMSDDDMPQEDDRLIEDILADEDHEEPEECPFCGQPFFLCQCDLLGMEDDI